MKYTIALALAISSMFGACSSKTETPTVVAEESKEVQVAQKKSELSELEAKKSASTHLALKNWRWGDPQNVTEADDKFYLYYETPETEKRLIGQRVIIVNKSSGVVTYQKRR